MTYILGIWDGHDAGAALLDEKRIIAAVNEERFTRRKLEVQFPYHSIDACLAMAGVDKRDVRIIAASTSDPAKTLTRIFPQMKENYYQVRRRKKYISSVHLQKKIKFTITGIGPNVVSRALSESLLVRKLRALGFREFEFFLVDHHAAHAACAAHCAPFEQGAVVTLDGVGDGLSATVGRFGPDGVKRIAEISANDSLGLFFEQVTFLLNMRELEDEGKVMSLADLSDPEPENPMLDFFTVDGIRVKGKYSTNALFSKLREMAFKLPWEKFAWMAQRALEAWLLELFQNVVKATGSSNVAWSGGIAANVKANQKIRLFSGCKNWFVFPHMGDGGVALGAALHARAESGMKEQIPLPDAYLGTGYAESEIADAAKALGLPLREENSVEEKAADLLAAGNVVLWCQGRMEFGPRALGNRSILAPAGDLKAKDDLNKVLKRRSWFQPFCPTILFEDGRTVLDDADDAPSPFMTMAYRVKPELFESIKAAASSDGSCRPQLLQDENPPYRKLLEAYKKRTGSGWLLNTSFNRHGEPLVRTPREALAVLMEAGFPYLVIDRFLFENPSPKIPGKKTKALKESHAV